MDGGARQRPRLAGTVRARRHLAGDQVHVVLSDEAGRMLKLGEREWTVLSQMDGSRDAEGIRRAAERAGAPVRLEHVQAFIDQLGELGLLEHEQADEHPPTAFPRDLPVVSLPGYGFACDGSGTCCRTFGTVLFTPVEAARARATLPAVREVGHAPARVFLPERGLDRTLYAVTLRDGACLYWADDGSCSLHAAAGPQAKPLGCRTFPMRFVDAGHEIRASPGPQCACVFASAESGEREPPVKAARGLELPEETFVSRLPDTVRMGPARVGAAEFVRWCDALEPPRSGDAAAWAWALAEQVGNGGWVRMGPAQGRQPSSEVVAGYLEDLRSRTVALARQHADYRVPQDLARRATEAFCEAIDRMLEEGPSGPGSDPGAEHLYLRTTLFGLDPGLAARVEDDLRERALHLWLARAFPVESFGGSIGRYPLALVETLARGYGLNAGGTDRA